MKNINKKTIVWIVISVLVLSLFLMINALISEKNNNELQVTEYEKQIDSISKQRDKQSDIEILWSKADYARQDAEEYLADINEAKELIKTLEPQYELSLLRVRCNKSQIERMINGIEYNVDFCQEETNLESFRETKKY